MLDVISMILSQEFLMRAMLVGVLTCLCCALLGVSLVLKRFSMIGDGLSHVGFGAMAIGAAAGVAPLYFALPIVIVAAFLLLRMSEKGKIKGDAAIALISTGALAQFREPDKDYIFITEAGLWSSNAWIGTGDNGLLAGYRICPPDQENWDMSDPENRKILKQNIIRIGVNQIAQIVWKIQIGGLEQLGGIDALYPQDGFLSWKVIV